jgi:hypothetical protein
MNNIGNRHLREFVNNLLEALSYSKLDKVPIGTEKFKKGVKNLKAVLETVYPQYYETLTSAFTPEIITGDYPLIEKAICSSPITSLEACFDMIHININPPSSIQKPTEMFEILAESFCKGIGLEK